MTGAATSNEMRLTKMALNIKSYQQTSKMIELTKDQFHFDQSKSKKLSEIKFEIY